MPLVQQQLLLAGTGCVRARKGVREDVLFSVYEETSGFFILFYSLICVHLLTLQISWCPEPIARRRHNTPPAAATPSTAPSARFKCCFGFFFFTLTPILCAARVRVGIRA